LLQLLLWLALKFLPLSGFDNQTYPDPTNKEVADVIVTDSIRISAIKKELEGPVSHPNQPSCSSNLTKPTETSFVQSTRNADQGGTGTQAEGELYELEVIHTRQFFIVRTDLGKVCATHDICNLSCMLHMDFIRAFLYLRHSIIS
jgi:hypothetical protein